MRTRYGMATILSALALIATALPAQQTTPQASSDNAAATLATAQGAVPAHANSKVRIVRLSEVKGEVQIDRNTGQGFEAAMANIPIIENARLQTGTGAAEVEFEDNSTLRVAPDSLVEFPQLELQPSGVKASTISVQKGMVYVSLINTKDEYTLMFGQERVHLQPSSHIRLQLEPTEAKLAVFEGSATVEGPSGTMGVGKKKTFVFNLADPNQPVVAKSVTSDPFDTWDHDSSDYHKRYASQSAYAGSPYSYGVSDMMYYGNFVNAGGCGSMWQPYFVSAGWDPFSNGAWAYYPGAGYSWVSPYPWGWTPYHYGNWISCPGAGWGWQPGGSWNGLGNQPVATTPGGQRRQPVQPPSHAPVGKAAIVMVNLKPLTASSMGKGDSFYFRKDSAGLGVPRGTLGKLDGFSREAMSHGSAWVPAHDPITGESRVGGRPEEGSMTAASRGGSMERPTSGAQSPFPASRGGSDVHVMAPAGGPSSGGGRPK